MTEDAVAFLEQVVGEPAHLFGHSIGAPVGLLVALRRPDLVSGLIFSEGVYHHDGWIEGVLDPLPPDVDEFLGGLYGEVSPHGAEHWASVWERLDEEHHRAPALTEVELSSIEVPTLLMFADNGTEVGPITCTRCTGRCPMPSSRSCPGPATDCPPTSPSSATGSSPTSSARTSREDRPTSTGPNARWPAPVTDEQLREAARRIWDKFNAHDLDWDDDLRISPEFENANALPRRPG